MDIIYNHPRWGVLVDSCYLTLPDVEGSALLDRWQIYAEGDFLKKHQTVAAHMKTARDVVAPMVIPVITRSINNISVEEGSIYDMISDHKTADTSCFNKHTSTTSIECLMFEAVERISVLCYAFRQERILMDNDNKNAPQILVDTLNLEVPHLYRLADDLPGFRQEFWGSDISCACGEYIADFADEFPHLLLPEEKAVKEGIPVLDRIQLQISSFVPQ